MKVAMQSHNTFITNLKIKVPLLKYTNMNRAINKIRQLRFLHLQKSQWDNQKKRKEGGSLGGSQGQQTNLQGQY